MALDERQILALVSEELSQSAGGNENDFIDSNRQAALATYLGQPDGKEVEGRSQIVSTDVADAIEWIMPEIVKAFTQNNEVVTFDPVFDGDEDQADLESQYVYDILMKDNNGFLIIHQFVKDALMQKNGFIKVFYENDEETSTESYTGLTEIEYNMVLADKGVELIEESTEVFTNESASIETYNIKISRTVDNPMIKVVCVPPEEFRVNKQHNSIDLGTARFTSHVMLKTSGDLVAEGHSREFVDTIPSSAVYDHDREYRFYMQDETVQPDRNSSYDPSLRIIEVAESYMRMDADEDGIAELVKVETAGGDEANVLLGIEEIDENPFISSTAILMSHKLFGLSLYDRLKQIQEQKTTLWRNIFDNMYLQNNQRTIVVESQVNLDDLMVSRPGGIIRAKRPDAVIPYPTPPLTGDSYKMMDYLDQVRASRSGVTPEGPVTDSMIGDRVGSEGVQSMMSQKEELVGLMIRVIAETGIKPLCYMIRNQVMRHQDVVKDYLFRGNWVKVNPMDWKKRSHTSVRVGTGSGNRQDQMAALGQVAIMQEKILMNPGQALIKEEQVFNVINDFCKFAGMPSARKYLLDPKSPEGQQNKKAVEEASQKAQEAQQKQEQALAEAQIKIANAEEAKAKVAGANVQLKNQVDTQKNQLKLQEQESDNEIEFLKQQLEQAKIISGEASKAEELQFRYWEAEQRFNIEKERIESQEEIASKQAEATKEKTNDVE